MWFLHDITHHGIVTTKYLAHAVNVMAGIMTKGPDLVNQFSLNY